MTRNDKIILNIACKIASYLLNNDKKDKPTEILKQVYKMLQEYEYTEVE